jgi:hypothetical protein
VDEGPVHGGAAEPASEAKPRRVPKALEVALVVGFSLLGLVLGGVGIFGASRPPASATNIGSPSGPGGEAGEPVRTADEVEACLREAGIEVERTEALEGPFGGHGLVVDNPDSGDLSFVAVFDSPAQAAEAEAQARANVEAGLLEQEILVVRRGNLIVGHLPSNTPEVRDAVDACASVPADG